MVTELWCINPTVFFIKCKENDNLCLLQVSRGKQTVVVSMTVHQGRIKVYLHGGGRKPGAICLLLKGHKSSCYGLKTWAIYQKIIRVS